LLNRPRLGRDFFARGDPEPIETSRRMSYEASLYDLLAAYARQAQRHAQARVRFKTRDVWSLAEAREALSRLLGKQTDWTAFDDFLLQACADSEMRRSARASAFSASLELAREGKLEIRQERAFAPLWLRPADPEPAEERAA
jgi:segregation and condensation protein A